jgi:hypothetical protein
LRFENKCRAEVWVIITWHLLRLHRWDKPPNISVERFNNKMKTFSRTCRTRISRLSAERERQFRRWLRQRRHCSDRLWNF